VNRQIGVRDFKYVGKFAPAHRTGQVVWRMRSGCKRIVNGILWDMSELITQERIAVGSSNLVEGLTTLPDTTAVNWQFVVELFTLLSFYYQRTHAGIALNFTVTWAHGGLAP